MCIPDTRHEPQADDLCGYRADEIAALLASLYSDQAACVIEFRRLLDGPLMVFSPDHEWEEVTEYLVRERARQWQGRATP
jgi:hypothetical protein